MMPDPFAEAAAALSESALGVEAVHIPPTGLRTACRVVPSRPIEQAPAAGEGRGLTLPRIEIAVPQAALITAPSQGDGFEVDGTAWTVAAPPEADPRRAAWRLMLRRA